MRGGHEQDDLYAQLVERYGNALARLLRGYEADEDKRRDLSQEIHLQLWRSLAARRALLFADLGVSGRAQHCCLARDP